MFLIFPPISFGPPEGCEYLGSPDAVPSWRVGILENEVRDLGTFNSFSSACDVFDCCFISRLVSEVTGLLLNWVRYVESFLCTGADETDISDNAGELVTLAYCAVHVTPSDGLTEEVEVVPGFLSPFGAFADVL